MYEGGIRITWTFGDEYFEKTLFFTPQTDCFIHKVSVFSPVIPQCGELHFHFQAWHNFLKRRENLFGCPGDVAIDGSAHLIDGEGFIFLFCTTDEAGETALTFSELYGLERDADYALTVVHSAESGAAVSVTETAFGTLSAESCIPIRMEAHTAMLLRIERVKP